MDAQLIHGDCRNELSALAEGCARLAYIDPPFFTQKVHRLSPRDRLREFSFADLWSGHEQYAKFLFDCLSGVWRALADDGSVVLHCDRRSAHIARAVLDRVFGADFFRSEIIWSYRRWSNATRALLPSHQTLYVYGKSARYVFNPIYGDYSPATNVDQLLQRRVRDAHGKSIYARDADGEPIAADPKRGVPLGDVWDIPYLNPKARERVGYPTQKPVLLLERVIALASDPGDLVLDPCCGSGTTLVAAQLLGRRAIGIDRSPEAIAISRERLREPFKTESSLLERGRDTYRQVDATALLELGDIELIPVQRNRGMDAILRRQYRDRPVAVRVQRPHETPLEAAIALARAGESKRCALMLLIVTDDDPGGSAACDAWPARVVAVDSTRRQIAKLLGAATAIGGTSPRGRCGSNQPALNESTLDEHCLTEPK
ncbi:MAG TPA: site-specific DNA-methyltransferase [Polyangiaceae bacterium]|nr:site-specific DNA-methyltransferase [Polyangiaceae bacterium]